MAESRVLHDKTKECMPESMQLNKPNALAVAILKPDRKPDGPKYEDDYLWVKCFARTTAEKLHEQCTLKAPPGEAFRLVHNASVLHPETTIGSISSSTSSLVVLEQIREAELETRLGRPRSALQQIDHQQAMLNARNAAINFLDKGRNGVFEAPRPSIASQDENQPPGQSQFPSPAATPPLQERIDQNRRALSHGPQPATSTPGSVSSPSIYKGSSVAQLRGGHVQSPASYAMPAKSSAQAPPNIPGAASGNGENEAKIALRKELDESRRNRSLSSSLSQASAQDEGQPSFQIHHLLKDAEPEILESSVDQGVRLLQRLRKPLESKAPDSSDAMQWVQQIGNLQKQAARTKTIIGVVGNTGAGKSSVINAMLDEERLVPTNCMRACTAVVTEISWNDHEQPYRAEIEFISPEDWRKELEILFNDLLDMNGNVSRDSTNEDSDAGVAYAKIKAVYPQMTKEDMANSSIDTMLRGVSNLLGTTRHVDETESSRFYAQLQYYVDSKEKTTAEKVDKKKGRREREFWPLIRVVRIFVKSPALSTGAVIVDLPGVHDSNAARAAVAEGYMKRCTGLWIVAPINRAVDDKAAKNLLGESFRGQLRLDGGFNAVTFICSKTDDISLQEAQDSLGIGDELGQQWAEIDRLGKSIKDLEKRLKDLKESKSASAEIMNDADDQLEVWDKLKDELEEGKTVFAPTSGSSSKKRKAGGTNGPRKKRRAASFTDDDDDLDETEDDDYEEEDSDAEAEPSDENKDLLTEEQISSKIIELKTNKRKARQEKAEIEGKVKTLVAEIKASQAEENTIEAGIAAKCIAGRNLYSKTAIQQDYAAGIKELDQEQAAEEDEDSFDPETDVRDYDEVARSLKCFCVSSRAYQKLSGRLRKDPSVPGFQTFEETEMPQLQAHCKELTKEGRSADCRKFINSWSQLLNSLTLWCSNDGTGQNLSAEQRDKETRLLSNNLKKLEDGLDKTVEMTCKDLAVEFGDNIFDRYDTAVENAVAEANTISQHWGAPVNRDNRALGGLCWSSYKAVCRRDGVYTNASGPHEWNTQLSAPMMKVLSPGWEKMFSRRTPVVMANFVKLANGLIKTFHQDTDSRACKIGLGLAGLHGLKQQLSVHENILKDVSREAAEFVNNTQKEINREFVPSIQEAMTVAYQQCVAEHGPGSYKRMKTIMTGHVDQTRHSMFQQSVDGVRQQLMKLTKDVEAKMNDKTDEVFVAMQRDYRSVLGGGAPEGQLLPKSERVLRKEVLRIVEGVETIFRKVAAGEKLDKDEDDEDPEEARRRKSDVLRDRLLLEADTPVKREGDAFNNDINKPDADDQPVRAIKPEAQEDQMMPEAQGGTSNGGSSSTEATQLDIKREVPETTNVQLMDSKIA